MVRAIRAVVLDFDGLILDTERPIFDAFRWLFEEHGCSLSLEQWAQTIGSREAWDPIGQLRAEAGFVDEAKLGSLRGRVDAALAAEAVLPGVLELLDEAEALGWPVAVASSSTVGWVQGHLERLSLTERFVSVHCFEEGSGVEAKPAPDLYLAALASLGVAPEEAVAFEDSFNGVAAAKAAGMWCVAVPHGLTAGLDLSAADLVVSSLEEVSLRALAGQLGRPVRSGGA